MTNDEALKILPNMKGAGDDWDKAIDLAIEALKQVNVHDLPKDADCISRQAVIDAAIEAVDSWDGCCNIGRQKRIHNAMMQLPSVQPTYTDEEIQKMQDMEQAEIEKAFELGREDAMAEIVRCKDCKHHWTHLCMDAFPREICDLDQTFYDSNFDYCSLAERRTNETD